MRDIRAAHLEQTIKDAKVGDDTKGRMKSLYNQMFRYAMKHEIVDEYCLKLMVGHQIGDVTEKVYTHRTIENLRREIEKIP